MKKILLCILIFSQVKSYSQQPELIQNTWQLTHLIENGVTYYPPVFPFEYITMNFNVQNSDFSSSSCNTIFAPSVSYTASNTFQYNFVAITLGTCPNSNQTYFESRYFQILYDPQYQSIISYVITQQNSNLYLELTNINNKKAFYQKSTLKTSNFQNESIQLYPNPTNDIVYLNSNMVENKNITIQISNSLGQILQSKEYETTPKSIDLSNYDSGMYFLELKYENKTNVFKVIKN